MWAAAGSGAGSGDGSRRRPGVTDVNATPPTSNAAAHQRRGLTDSPRNSAAADMPKTGTSSENGATVDAGWRRSSRPQAPKPKTVVIQAT